MEDTPRLRNELILELIAFGVLVASVSLLWRYNVILFVVALVECAIGLVLWHGRLEVSFFLIIGLLGSLAEVIFVHAGVWEYANPTVSGLPLWFPPAFGTTGLIGARLASTLTGIWDAISPLPEPKK
jgi:uncharacterized membrane protein YoaT (DUF817 family)